MRKNLQIMLFVAICFVFTLLVGTLINLTISVFFFTFAELQSSAIWMIHLFVGGALTGIGCQKLF